MVDTDILETFTNSCGLLGAEVHGRAQRADKTLARTGFSRVTARVPEQCDGWRGLAAAGDTSRQVLEFAYRAVGTCGQLLAASPVDSDALNFDYDSGLYVLMPAVGENGVQLAYAAALINGTAETSAKPEDYKAASELLDEKIQREEPLRATWQLAVLYFKAGRWHDVRKVLAKLPAGTHTDARLRQAVAVANGVATAYLGMWDKATELLAEAGGPMPTATAEALLTAALCARALEKSAEATTLLNEAYAVDGDVAASVRERISTALSDPEYGILATSAARIEARTDPWDESTEPSDSDSKKLTPEKRAELYAESQELLDELVGMEGPKGLIARIESNGRARQRRQEKDMKVRDKTLHLVIEGPTGVGKTKFARAIHKRLCGAGVLPNDLFVELSGRGLIDDVIGGSEKNLRDVIDRIVDAGGGTLFLDEAYALDVRDSKNDFGKQIIQELLTYMVTYADILMVVVAGYRREMEEFLDSNEGLRRRFARVIVIDSYTVPELMEITDRAAARGDSDIEDLEVLSTLFTDLRAIKVTDSRGVTRSGIDAAGNAGFANTLVEFAEEERDFRLDEAGLLDSAEEDALRLIITADIQAAANRIFRDEEIDLSTDSIARAEGGQVIALKAGGIG
ncbi:type VII secretion AAA-ATPase EccA [Mycobacteroides abscessus subsp. abscessus]|uniref:AAA family ATPase n=1 Tax=Mycobacteroides abscessus TaxID=36809 RepID=UPI0009291AAA|nr:AAA family ATPase [Mycobacteroides abscessus]SIJ21895.1 type VII secretion AAA-ATPase EccA [Mycobacteroides abscessus subsp. abscessus]SLH38712.1 type VII secretion AAA-ATPase EccA [Mycobacteroides abscessus subsp. abscessus]